MLQAIAEKREPEPNELFDRVMNIDWLLQQPGGAVTYEDMTAEEAAGLRLLHRARAAYREKAAQQDPRERAMAGLREADRRRRPPRR